MQREISIITSCYKGEKYIESFLHNLEQQTLLDNIELVLVHNDPSDYEMKIVESFKKKHPGLINHIIVPREPISVSMNRAIKNAQGIYIFNRDIDDIRTNNSIELQYTTLKKYDHVYLTYGDFVIIKDFEAREGQYVTSPEFEKTEFVRSMHCGPFRAWKKEIHEKVGYFDEQLRSGADYDLMIRIAYNYPMKKTHGLLGYYLNANTGLSTGQAKLVSLQQKELLLINKRYNVLDKIDLFIKASEYKIYDIKEDGEFVPVKTFVPHYHVHHYNLSDMLKSLVFSVKYGLLRIVKFIYLKIK